MITTEKKTCDDAFNDVSTTNVAKHLSWISARLLSINIYSQNLKFRSLETLHIFCHLRTEQAHPTGYILIWYNHLEKFLSKNTHGFRSFRICNPMYVISIELLHSIALVFTDNRYLPFQSLSATNEYSSQRNCSFTSWHQSTFHNNVCNIPLYIYSFPW